MTTSDHRRPVPRPRPTRRHILGASLLAAGSPLLSGCFGLGDTTGLVLDQPGGSVPAEFRDRRRVVIWSAYTALNAELIQKNIDAFHESQDEIYVDVQIFGGYDAVESKVTSSLQARQVPDIAVFSDVVWNRFIMAEALEPLSGYFDADFGTDAFHERFLAEGTVQDEIYCVPFGRSTPLFYYNREIFDAVGLPDRAPETYSEYAEWGREVAGLEYNSQNVAMRAYSGVDDWYFQGSIWAFGGSYSDGLDLELTTEASIAALEFDRAFIHDDGSGYMTVDDTGDFTAGACATILQSTGVLGGIKDAATFDFGCGLLPREVETGVPTGGGGLSIIRYASEQRKKDAWEVIRFLSSGQAAIDWTLGSGYVPCTRAAIESEEIAARSMEDPRYQIAIDQLEIAQAPDIVRRFVPGSNVVARNAIQSVYSSGTSAVEVLGVMEKELESAVERVREKYELHVGEG